MKSFKAKLYIEDNLATIEFDVTMKGKYDTDTDCGWNFGIITTRMERKKGSSKERAGPPTLLSLSIYNEDDMRMVGEIVPTHQNTDYQKGGHSMKTWNRFAGKSYEEYIMAREISLQFLDLWLKGKECHKYNFIYKDIADGKPPISPHKYIRRGNYWHVYVKKFGEKEFTYVVEDNRAIQEGIYSEESMVEMKDVYEQIKHNKLSPTYPDGTPARTVQAERDENGNLQPKEN
jgi:hypothetical protein